MSEPKCTCDLRPNGLLPNYTDFMKDGRLTFEEDGRLTFEIKLVKCPLCEAAPDLLAACKAAMLLFNDAESRSDSQIIARLPEILLFAIAKAEGTS